MSASNQTYTVWEGSRGTGISGEAAWLAGRAYVTPDEVKTVFHPTLRHRVAVRPELALEGLTTDLMLDRILASVGVPR